MTREKRLRFEHTVIDDKTLTTGNSVCLVADVNGNGFVDVIVGSYTSPPEEGYLVWYEYSDWKMHIITDEPFNPHILAVADFNNDGHMDIFVGEMGLGRHLNPRLFIYLGNGDGSFDEQIMDRGNPTHEAKVADIGNTGALDIVGKPFKPKTQVDLWKNMTG